MTENTTLTTPPKTAPVKCGLVAYLQLDGASRAAEFYREAFGAEVAAAHPPDAKGRTMHIHLYINGASLMLSDFYPEHGQAPTKPQGFTLTLMFSDIQSAWDRAIAAGAESVMPPTDMFWGDRYGALRDPFGVSWVMNQGMTE